MVSYICLLCPLCLLCLARIVRIVRIARIARIAHTRSADCEAVLHYKHHGSLVAISLNISINFSVNQRVGMTKRVASDQVCHELRRALLCIPKETYCMHQNRSTSVWGLANELDLTMSATNRTASNCQQEEAKGEEETESKKQ